MATPAPRRAAFDALRRIGAPGRESSSPGIFSWPPSLRIVPRPTDTAYPGSVDHVSFVDPPLLHEPAFVCAFQGWNDGGEAASTAVRYLSERWGARPLAYLDP